MTRTIASRAVRSRHQRLRRIIWLVLLPGLLILTHQIWLPLPGGYLIVADPLVRADAVVPLAGERIRVIYAAQLLHSGYADWYIISPMSVPGQPDYDHRAAAIADAMVMKVDPDQMVGTTRTADSTLSEAHNLLELARRQNWNSLLVVTSPSHTRRARLILRDVFAGSDIRVIVVSQPRHWYTAQSWWHTRAGIQETGLEYAKLICYLLGCQRYSHDTQPAPVANAR